MLNAPLFTLEGSSPLAEGQLMSFEYLDGLGRVSEGVLICHQGKLYAYQNMCPHWSIPMELDELFDAERELLVCPFHGACFELDGGLCIEGPPLGHHLVALRVEVDLDQDRVNIWRRPALSI